MKQRPAWLYVIGAIILAFGLFLIVPDRNVCSPDKSTSQLVAECVISYSGAEGRNALDLLKASHQVETQHFSFGDMVTSIDGLKAPATHFWEFNVNGQPATAGAGDYQTSSTDTLTWRLVPIQ